MRTAFVKALTKLAAENKNIWLITGDLGFSFLEDFSQRYPEQYLNAGVAEQNMIGMAAGAAMSGKIIFTYSIAPFITLRALEQVRNDVCMQNANVKLVGVGEGFSYGQLGPTHHSIEDIAVMRSLPNMVVVCPGDPWEVEKATLALTKMSTPAYLRIGKKGEPVIHTKKAKFVIGKGITMSDGKDLTLISTGNMLESTVLVGDQLSKRGLKAKVISMHTVKPLDNRLVLESAKETGAIFTIEEHSIIGGLGSAVSEVVAQSGYQIKFSQFGIRDKYTKMAGSQKYLRMRNGLSIEQIYKEIIKIMTNGK